jgi:hypothetical protein
MGDSDYMIPKGINQTFLPNPNIYFRKGKTIQGTILEVIIQKYKSPPSDYYFIIPLGIVFPNVQLTFGNEAWQTLFGNT